MCRYKGSKYIEILLLEHINPTSTILMLNLFDCELQATVTVKPVAPLAAGTAGLLLLIGCLATSLPLGRRQVIVAVATILMLAALLMAIGVLPILFRWLS